MTAQELKNSILMQAVQGKLVPQDPNDEPASVLLAKIRAEKEQMMKEGKIKKEPISEIYIDPSDNQHYEKVGKTVKCIENEIPFKLPNGWAWCRCSSIGNMVRGKGIKRTETVSDGYPCVRYGEIYTSYNTSFDKTISFIPESLYNICNHFGYGDIVFTLTGENKQDIAKAITYIGNDSVAAGGDMAYWTNHQLNPFYITYYLSSPYAIDLKRETATGDIIVHISTSKVGLFLIPVPPLNEQERIVKRIAELEPYIKNYNQLYEKINSINTSINGQLKKSILQYAIRGKLVAQNPDDEPASELIKRIRAEKEKLIKTGKLKKDKNESYIYRGSDNSYYEKFQNGKETCIDDEIPFEIPQSWEWCRHNALFDISGGSQPPKSKFSSILKSGYIRLYQIRDYGQNPIPVYIPEELANKRTNKGDILLARYGASLGKVFYAETGAYNVAMAKIIPLYETPYIYIDYLFYFYNSSLYRTVVLNNSRSAQAGFNKEDLKHLWIPIPPYEEQIRIVSAIEEYFNLL